MLIFCSLKRSRALIENGTYLKRQKRSKLLKNWYKKVNFYCEVIYQLIIMSIAKSQ